MPDWSDQSEGEMVERFRPEGERLVTAAPTSEISSRRVVIQSSSEGASIGFRVDDGAWRVYTGPIDAPPGSILEARAVRYGWKESATTRFILPDS